MQGREGKENRKEREGEERVSSVRNFISHHLATLV